MGLAETVSGTIANILLTQRQALLDLSTRNRLLNVPLRTRNVRTIEIVDEKSEEIFRILNEGKSFTFLPGRQLMEDERQDLDPDDNETGGIPQPNGDEEKNEHGVAARHVDTKLQTRLTSEGLQKRLFEIWYDARTLEEEQGVNILFLAFGLLQWYEDDKSEVVRHAPLVLLPVQLERSNAGDRFRLKSRSEPAASNLTLQAKLKAEFGIILDGFEEDEELHISDYLTKAAKAISGCKKWEVLPDAMVLGFFSFSKFLMYRDLDPENWPSQNSIDGNPLVTGVLREGFPESEPIIPDGDHWIDPMLPAAKLHHVVDADSSQAVAIEEAASGRTLVIKGPPGTGKSQTITNIIAAAVARGKKVLFVAEKLAALDVVRRRLEQANLGAVALELHSNKANKRVVLEELRRTRQLQLRQQETDPELEAQLDRSRGELNRFVQRLHTPLYPCGLSPFEILGHLGASVSTVKLVPRLDGATSWTKPEYLERGEIVKDLAHQVSLLGNPASHPWRGIQCTALDPVEIGQLMGRLEVLSAALQSATGIAKSTEQQLGGPDCRTISDFHGSLRFLAAAKDLPNRCDRTSLANDAWIDRIGQLAEVVETGKRARRDLDQAHKAFHDRAFDADLRSTRYALEVRSKSIFRFFSGEYKHHVQQFAALLHIPLPKRRFERLQLLGELEAAQRSKSTFEGCMSSGYAFGAIWQGMASDWELLMEILEWRRRYSELPRSFWGCLSTCSELGALIEMHGMLEHILADLGRHFREIAEQLNLDLTLAFGYSDWSKISIASLAERLALWRSEAESLSLYSSYIRKRRAANAKGLQPITDQLQDGSIQGTELFETFSLAYFDALRAELFRAWPELKEFDGALHATSIERFRQLDLKRIALAQLQVAQVHTQGLPQGAAIAGSPLGVLLGELAKKSRHLPIRVLLDKAGPAIMSLKPVFMMSPLSVAQFLKPGKIQFDLLVIDEASQVEPVDALGAIARSKQMVIVGDERQLPPTRFFAKLTSDGERDLDEDDESPTFEARDAESILDLCLARGVPDRMLNWHYRSKHQSLIAVSNHEFYESKLFIVPSPYSEIAGMGLRFHHLPHAYYDRGKTRTNPNEARVVAEAVMQHARAHPNHSLGVATFSVAQRQQILRELEILRRADPSFESFFEGGGTEPFFVKNLENVQGDERDVIFISVGYGKTETGYLAHNFGPLSNEGGERRLNVLISRAKIRCEVFSNIKGEDIDLERSRKRGVAALKMFLTFAETGRFGMGENSAREYDSVFEEEVAKRLSALGYDVRSQIGIAGFFIDLAIADPEKPGRYVLGIECDGAQYHSSRSARDRDRLRQQVLESQGWIIHRIWSADWYLRPNHEIDKVQSAINAAISEWRERDETGTERAHAVPISFDGDRVQYIEPKTDQSAALNFAFLQYQQATFPVDNRLEIHETPLGHLAEYVYLVVSTEGPIHIDEIATRIRTLWGLQRAGARIRTRIAEAIGLCLKQGTIVGSEFYVVPGKEIVPRDRSNVPSQGLRRPEYLPPQELDVALQNLVHQSYGAPKDELVTAAARLFGFASVSGGLREVLSGRVDDLVQRNVLNEREGLITRPHEKPPS